jgi:hypothetical protein
MSQRATWRQQEQALVERWNAATTRYQASHAELLARAPGEGAPGDELAQRVEAARAEIEALRRQIARMKREFLSGDRY